jgi:biopolymer transport protein ExbD
MAEIIANDSSGGKQERKKRAKRHSTHIDMTPMVDLMSLLITFFMLTTAFSKPKIMDIVLPNDSGDPPDQFAFAPRTMNILITGEDKIYYYIGKPPKDDIDISLFQTKIQKSDYGKDGIRKIILKMNMQLFEKVDSAEQTLITGKSEISQDSLYNLIKIYKKKDKVGPIVFIKADKNAKYKNIVDVIDEMAICNVARYTIVDMNEYETKLIESLP